MSMVVGNPLPLRPRRRRGVRMSSRQLTALWALATALVSFLLAAWVMRLWRADLSYPFRYTYVDDTKFYLMLIRSIVRNGWYGGGLGLGAPFGQQLYDFPQGADNLNFVVLRVLALFSSNPAAIANAFLLITFPGVALSAFFAARALGMRRASSCLVGVLFALLPYHFYRGESQLLLSAYWSVPVAAYLFLAPLTGRELLASRWRTIACCVIVASCGLYYAAFGVSLLVIATLACALRRMPRSVVLGSAAAAALVVLVLGANLASSLAFRAEHGANPAISRTVADSDALGLHIAQLLLPVQDHRLPLLHSLNRDYGRATQHGYCEQCYETLGTVGDVGLVWLVGGGLLLLLGLAGGAWAAWPLFRPLSFGVLATLLLATTGGMSALIAFVVTPDIRGWDRMSLFIAFFSLLAAARLLSLVRARRLGVALLVAVILLGALDETSSDFIPAYAAAAAEYRSDVAFAARMQDAMPRNAAIFELPYVPFPEGYGVPAINASLASPGFGTSYEELRPYIASSGSLRFSFGAMKGRATDWASQLAAKPLAMAVAGAAASGFDGLLVMPAGYAVPRGRLLSALETQLGERPLVSADRSQWLFDLRPYARRLVDRHALRTAVLHPLRVACGGGVVNPGGPVWATFTMRASGPTAIRYPDGSAQRGRGAIAHRLLVPPGHSRIVIRTSAPYTAPTLTADALSALGAGPIRAGFPAPACP